MIFNNYKLALFTLFHHDIHYQNKVFGFDTSQLYEILLKPPKYQINDIGDVIYGIIKKYSEDYKNSEISLTLTGGMDSRVILAALLKAGVEANCMTFGNSGTPDVVLAKNIAESFNLPFHNVAHEKPDKEWYFKWVIETIKRDNGNAHLHRAHRTAAISEHANMYKPKILFTGHMGGEGLRGLSYNNYFSSPFFERVNEGKVSNRNAAVEVLNDYFLKLNNIDFDTLLNEVNQLSWMKNGQRVNKLFFLYDLVAKIHHAQDIRLYQSFVSEVVPVYLQKDYLETVFNSPYNFLHKGEGLLNRLKNPYVYCKIIEYLYPPLLDFPLSNGFTPKEYLKGLWYYIPVKLYRNRTQKHKFPPTFSYRNWYVDFVKEHSQSIRPEIWEIYDRDKYMHALYNNEHRNDEGYWHKFSNPIFFNMIKTTQG